jgi:hypothetical protein
MVAVGAGVRLSRLIPRKLRTPVIFAKNPMIPKITTPMFTSLTLYRFHVFIIFPTLYPDL